MRARAKRGRLTHGRDFDQVYKQGKSRSNRYVVLYQFPRSGAEEPRTGISISRKVGGAVDRNKLKRLLNEAFREISSELDQGCDYVVVARTELKALAEKEGLSGVKRELSELVTKGGERGAEA